MFNITKLLEERARVIGEMRSTQDAADAESRVFTAEETQAYERQEARVSEIDADVERRNRAAKLTAAPGITPDAEITPGEGVAEQRTARLTDTPEYRAAFTKWMQHDTIGLSREEYRVLSKASATAGLNLVPTAFEKTLIDVLRDYGVMRDLATVITTDSGETIQLPVVNSHGSAAWIAENGAFTPSDDAFGQLSIGAWKNGTIIQVSEELLQDSAFALEPYISNEFGKRIGVIENTAYVVGDGSSKPQGITTSANLVLGLTLGVGNTVQFTGPDDLIDLYHSVLPVFRRSSSWLMNDATIKKVRKFKDTTGQYLWQPGLLQDKPDTILGRPVYADPDMPVQAANAVSVIFGDIAQAYLIRDTRGIQMQRLVELYAANGQVGFRAYHRTDGKLVNPQAVRALKQSAT